MPNASTQRKLASVMGGDWILGLDDMERSGGFVETLLGMGSSCLCFSCLVSCSGKVLS